MCLKKDKPELYDDPPITTSSTTSSLYDAARSNAPETLAKRDKRSFRYDIISGSFLYAMAQIANYGVEHYGEGNWMKSRLVGNSSPINHMMAHIVKYQQNEPYDHLEIGAERRIHLAAIAFNAMMEYYYECHPELNGPK